MAFKLEDFLIGDVVKLHSSSTKMTVAKIDRDNEMVIAHWFDDADQLQEFPFAPDQLSVVKKATEF